MRNKYLLRKYGITEDEYEALLVGQGKRCSVCGRCTGSFQRRLAVDHDHKTGEIRGLLCTWCNRYIIGRHRGELGSKLFGLASKYLAGPYTGKIVPKKKKRRRKKRK